MGCNWQTQQVVKVIAVESRKKRECERRRERKRDRESVREREWKKVLSANIQLT